jgi:Na+-transporting methylmalonyl-CoA/oxaloacetate decarboxylase gamma subunit
MKTFTKIMLAALLCVATLPAMAQDDANGDAPHPGCPMHALTPSVDFQSVKMCYVPDLGAFVAIDSVECCVHMVAMTPQGLDTVGAFVTDNTRKRHDLKNILRPVSVSAMGPYVLVLASAVNDSAYVAILDSNMHELTRRSFSSPMYAMHREHGVLIVAGRNPYGYDLNIVPLRGLDFEAFATGDIMTHHYRVAKQSEKIKQTDPVGIGLTAVAVAVVFLALVFIALILQGGSKLMSGVGEKKETKKKGGAAINAAAAAASKEGEIYAAIATAIHLYNNELHDEEDTVITIAKVEREWTPWNAKYYNMNHYFNNKR